MTLADACRATGLVRDYLDRVEVEAREHGVSIILTDDRERLAYLCGGAPACAAWKPRPLGGAEGFWLDFVDESGASRGCGGGAVYNLGPMNFAELVNDGGLWRGGDTSLRISGKAEEFAADLTDVVGMSGNLVVWRREDRKTAFSAWMRSTVPVLNKAVLTALYDCDHFVAFVRNVQVPHLAPAFGLDCLVNTATFSRRFHADMPMTMGYQSRESAERAMRLADAA